MVESLLALDLIPPNWQCVVVFLGKTLNAHFLLGPSSLSVVVPQPDESLANENGALHYCGSTEIEIRLMRTNNRTSQTDEVIGG